VGVHIADVSYFVREGTPLDMEAARRATTVSEKVVGDGNRLADWCVMMAAAAAAAAAAILLTD